METSNQSSKKLNLSLWLPMMVALIALVVAVVALVVPRGGQTDIAIGEDGYWVINGEKTDVYAKGEQGAAGATGAQGEKATRATREMTHL